MKHLPEARPLTWKGDLAAKMVAGTRTVASAAQ